MLSLHTQHADLICDYFSFLSAQEVIAILATVESFLDHSICVLIVL
jgi:hypothetical protein